MSEAAAPKKKRKRGGCLKKLFYCFLPMLGIVFLWAAFNIRSFPSPGEPLLPVSKELTILTEPLDENGDVDYLEALNLQYSSGVTTANNAMVKIAEALGPRPKAMDLNAEFCRRLGIPELPVEPAIGNYFKPIEQWRDDGIKQIRDRSVAKAPDSGMASFDEIKRIQDQTDQEIFDELGIKPPESSDEHLDEPFDEHAFYFSSYSQDLSVQADFATSNPWSPDELPSVEKWLYYNVSAIEKVEEGLSRPDYYHPLVSSDKPKVMTVSLEFINEHRELSRHFATRSMMNLHLGKVEESLKDIESMFRLAELTASGPTIVEELYGIAITGIATGNALQVAIHPNTSATHLLQLRQLLARVKPIGGIVNRIDEIERYTGLEIAIHAGRGQIGETTFGQNAGAQSTTSFAAQIADFKATTSVLNAQYDACAEMLRTAHTAEQRESATEKFEIHMVQLETDTVDPWKIAKTVVGGRKAKGRWIGQLLSGMLMPATTQVLRAETRAKSKLNSAMIYVAVCHYQKENGRLPESLDDLMPEFIDQLPLDPFTDRPFVFSKTDDGFRIHSDLWPPVDEYDETPFYDDQLANTEYLSEPHVMTWNEFLEDKIGTEN